MDVQVADIPKESYDVLFRLVLIGDSGVGKTALLCRYSDNTFDLSFITTIGIDFRIKTVTVHGRRVKLQIWDTAGQEKFQSVASSYYRNAHGILLIYDVTGANSFIHITKWVENIGNNAPSGVQMVLVGNKCDREETLRVIASERGEILARELGMPFMETSAMNDVNVDLMFELITSMILKEQLAKEKAETVEQSAVISDEDMRTQDFLSREKRRAKCCLKS